MRLVAPSFEIVSPTGPWTEMLNVIELGGRVCYKSEDKITQDSSLVFAKKIIESGHHSVLEHSSISVRFVCDRGVSHEIVRHRIASYSQESTRYCNYSRDKFGGEVTFIDARPHLPEATHAAWMGSLLAAEEAYLGLLKSGVSAQIARSVLPNALKTEMVMTANAREWRHFFDLRTSNKAHPQMREVARPLLEEFRRRVPVLFDGVGCVA